MPILGYTCKDCNQDFDHFKLGNDDNSLPQCTHCNSLSVKKTITAPGNYFIHGNNSASQRPKGIGKKSRGAK